MPTLRELLRDQTVKVKRPGDAEHYQRLIAMWGQTRGRWPADAVQAGDGSLIHAVFLAIQYKGQTDYPDGDNTERLLNLLTRCSRLDSESDAECEGLLEAFDHVPGIGLARASVFLHCLYPGSFPIVDVNAARALCDWCARSKEGGKGKWPAGVRKPSFEAKQMVSLPAAYLDYRKVLLALVDAAKDLSDPPLTLRQIEFALYKSRSNRRHEMITGL